MGGGFSSADPPREEIPIRSPSDPRGVRRSIKESSMRVMEKLTTRVLGKVLLSLILLLSIDVALPSAGQAPRSSPEAVGFSAERLKRVSELMKRHIDAGSFS